MVYDERLYWSTLSMIGQRSRVGEALHKRTGGDL